MAKMTSYDNNIAGLKRALRQLPKEAKAELKGASKRIAGEVAADAQARAAGLGGAWRYLAPTIRAGGSTIPEVKIGGKRKLPKRTGDRQTVGDLLWGLEFGGGARPTTQQFMPHLGRTGYALWPAVREHSDETGKEYSKALLTALEAIE